MASFWFAPERVRGSGYRVSRGQDHRSFPTKWRCMAHGRWIKGLCDLQGVAMLDVQLLG